MKVIVVGAGPAGLAAAYRLKQTGIADITVLEKRDRIGGRTATWHRQGFTIDTGAQFLMKNYDTTFALCREMGIIDELTAFLFKAAIWKNGRLLPVIVTANPAYLIQSLRNQEHPLRSFIDLSLTGGLRAREMGHLMRLLLFILRRRRELHFTDLEHVHKLDSMSLAGIGRQISSEEVVEYLLDPITGCLVLGEPDKISASYGLALLKYVLLGSWTMKGGIGSIAGHLFEACRADVEVSTSARQIVVEDRTVKGVITDKGVMDADAVVCATTATRALALIPDLPPGIRGPLEKVRYHACCHVVLAYPEKVLKNNCYSVILPFRSKASMAGFTDNAVKAKTYAPEGAGLMQCFTYGRHASELNAMPADKAARFVIDDIRMFVPNIPETPIFSEVYPWAEAMCSAPPGMLTAIQKMKRESIDEVKGLYLAGDYLNMPSVEGALKSGIDAANRLLRR